MGGKKGSSLGVGGWRGERGVGGRGGGRLRCCVRRRGRGGRGGRRRRLGREMMVVGVGWVWVVDLYCM